LNPGSAKHEFIGKDKAADIFNLNEKLEGSNGTMKCYVQDIAFILVHVN